MTLNINIPQLSLLRPKISVFGVGGAGRNALNNMIKSNLEGIEFIAADNDAQTLANSLASNRIQLGIETTKGLGAGSFPDRGRVAAEESSEEILKHLKGNNMIFITAGMGGGTGTGGAPVIAKLAREEDPEMVVVGVVTKPFDFEGKYRMEAAEIGIRELKKHVNTLIIIPNQNLFRIANEQTTFGEAFQMADNVLHAGIRGITDLITMPGLINLDFADVRTTMTKMGQAMMGTGEAEGEDRAINACLAAISNPLLDNTSIKGAKGVLVNITGGMDMTLFEVDAAINTIKQEVDENANIIFGSAFNEEMNGRIRISVVATGIDAEEPLPASKKSASSQDSKNNSLFSSSANFIEQNGKTFFDPGLAKEPSQMEIKPHFQTTNEDNLVAVNKFEDDFETIQEEEDKSWQFSTMVNTPLNTREFKTSLNNNSFAHNLLKEEAIDTMTSRKPAKTEPLKKKAKPKKESNSGFGLFNFMNYSKNKVEEKDTINIKIIDEEQGDEESQDINVTIEKKPHNSNKEKYQLESDNFELEDDIYNIPAFFRKNNK